jgi:signal peptidase I
VSDGWDWGRPEVGDDDENDETEPVRESPGGWPEDAAEAGRESPRGWPDDDDPETDNDAQSDWPTPGPSWQQPGYGRPQREGEPADFGQYPDYGYGRRDERLSGEAGAEPYDAQRSRDPLARLFPGLPHGVRVTLDWILTIVGAIAIVVLLKVFVVNPYRIPSSSMETTLNCAKPAAGCLGNSSDRVLACRVCLDFGPPSRGDIVVFNTPTEAALKCGEGGTFVKRVIGLPGETVREDVRGNIWIRKPGEKEFTKLAEPYLSAARRLADTSHFGQKWHVPKGDYFMMGDNRSQSCDSRTWGSVPRSKLIGIVFFVYWPPDRIGFR